jgi:benzoylformate decarboxylase
LTTRISPAGDPGTEDARAGTVRAAALEVMRTLGLTTIFANPGSTEIDFLVGLPDDFAFRLGLHEGAVVGMATGWSMGQGRPAFVNLHTTAGLGNAVGALATARVNRVPLVVVVGQQDRRHLAHEPFLSGRLEGLAGQYPVWTGHPVRPQDVPALIARAFHEAVAGSGPALVVVPMDDWNAPAPQERGAAPLALVRAPTVATDCIDAFIGALDAASSPVIVTGAGADDRETWSSLELLATKLGAPVWQEPFGARAGFRQDHPNFRGHLPATRSGVRKVLARHDVLLVVGAPVLRQYPFEPGDLVPAGTRVLHITQFPDEAHNSVADLVVVAEPDGAVRVIADRIRSRRSKMRRRTALRPHTPPAAGEQLSPTHVFDLLAAYAPADTILVEESPSSRAELHRRFPAREPLGFVSAAAGGLGFGLPAAVGLKLGAPSRPVVAVLGDGSSLYGIQGLWSAAYYGAGVLFLVLANGGYTIMDGLAERSGWGKPPWPSFTDVRMSTLGDGFGCPTRRIATHDELNDALQSVLPNLAERCEPLLLDIAVGPEQLWSLE